MTQRKHKSYTCWLKWKHTGWEEAFTVIDGCHGWNPRKIIKDWYESFGELKLWAKMKILPKGQVPK